jgi:hypothetical protein
MLLAQRVITHLICLLGLAGLALAASPPDVRWKLLYEERFDRPIDSDVVPWERVHYGPGTTIDAVDDDGQFFHGIGGDAFLRQLQTIATYRKRVSFGKDHWLTAELSARGDQKAAKPNHPPCFKTERLPSGETVGRFLVPEHHGGILLRPTRPLPGRYRIEVLLVQVDFGGTRYDQWNYDTKINGYGSQGAKTNHPWPWGPGEIFSKPYPEWTDARNANGFYYLTIVDYPDPAPRNNIFIHTHRKVGIDAYNVAGSGGGRGGYDTCDPIQRLYYQTHDNTVNMIFFSTGSALQSNAMMETPCGIAYGNEAGRTEVVAAGQMAPEILPKEKYRFAIERDARGYTLEASGFFWFAGQQTYRYHRGFIQDGRPIWHYNQTSEEYQGQFDSQWVYQGPYGTTTVPHSWPAGSAYPDYFIIGDPHTNYYEGTAAITNLRLYIPEN